MKTALTLVAVLPLALAFLIAVLLVLGSGALWVMARALAAAQPWRRPACLRSPAMGRAGQDA